MWTLKNGKPYFHETDQQALYERRIANEGHEPISEADALAILNPSKTLQELAATAMAQVNAEYSRRMGAIADDYPLHERESWPVQLQEAKNCLENAEVSTPWIDQCAAQRGISRELLAQKIVDKDLQYRIISGFYSGVRQMHEDQIDALLLAEDREALENYKYLEGWEQS